ncbi:hypothetical protein MBANPS3_006515 [Mucor bainieri]
MNNSQQEDGGRERQRPHQYQRLAAAAAAPENIFTNICNVIAGARESASQEFTRFWESLGHAQRPYYYSTSSPSSSSLSPAVQARKIKTPISVRHRQFSRNNSNSINGRFLPDDNVRGSVKDVEIQTDDDLLQPSALSIPHKRSASSTFEEYHIPFPVKKNNKKTSSFSLAAAERDTSFGKPAFLSRRIDTSNEDFSNQAQQEPSQQETQEEQGEPSQPEEQEKPEKQEKQQEQTSTPQATSAGKKESEPLPPPPTWSSMSLSPKRESVRKAMSLSPNRPVSSTTFKAASAGRFTLSPNKDVRTGSKSVRRLTMELEGQFSPKFPSPYSPKRQRQEATTPMASASASASPQYDRQGEASPSTTHYRSELAATLATQAQAASAIIMASHTPSPVKPLQPSPSQAPEAADEKSPATNKDEEDYHANLLKQRELDERVNKLEKKVSIARTRVSEFSGEGPGIVSNSSSSSTSSSHIISPTPSHTILNPGRHAIPTARVAPAANASKTTTSTSPARDARVSTSPYRSSIMVSSAQQPTKETSVSPSSTSYAAARAAIQEAVNRKGSASPFGERISSVRSTMSRPLTPVPPPPAPPPPPPQPATLSASASSPSRVYSSSTTSTSPYRESSTYYPPKHTPSPYLQPSSSTGITQLKPNDQHKSKMKEVIKMIPHFNLRKADTIIGPDGVVRPNPIWLDIYDPKRRRLYDQGL